MTSDKTQCSAAVWTVNYPLPKFHQLLIIKSPLASGPTIWKSFHTNSIFYHNNDIHYLPTHSMNLIRDDLELNQLVVDSTLLDLVTAKKCHILQGLLLFVWKIFGKYWALFTCMIKNHYFLLSHSNTSHTRDNYTGGTLSAKPLGTDFFRAKGRPSSRIPVLSDFLSDWFKLKWKRWRITWYHSNY